MFFPVVVDFICRRLKLPVLLVIFFAFLNLNTMAGAHDNGYVKPAEKSKCPVCGMFVAKYPDWIAEVLFKDGTYKVFDGPKDMFIFLSRMKQYDNAHQLSDITALYIMDYYSVRPIDGTKAFYVTGSDVYGPMGAEFIPFEKETDASEFVKDHKGQRICRYRDITPKFLEEFD